MNRPLSLFICIILSFCAFGTFAQSQPNIGFEDGTTNVWEFSTGVCCPLNIPTLTTAIPGRHTLTSGSGTDYYGHFPTVSPYGGSYSMMLGNNNTGSEAERATYYVHVPSGTTNYSIIYHYAIVLEDGGHDTIDQPRFAVNVYDSITRAPVSCAQFLYVASSDLPGFTRLDDGIQVVYYRPWTTGSINLSGYEGKTVSLVFSTGDCAQGGHFGYAYIDVTTGLFAINSVCNTDSTVLSGPSGYAHYSWYDSATFAFIDSSSSITVGDSTTTRVFALVLQPFAGYGCPDTLYTRYTPSSQLKIADIPAKLCLGDPIVLSANVSGNNSSLSYSWAPASAVDCATCQSVTLSSIDHFPFLMILTASDQGGCSTSDSIWVTQEDCTLLWVPDAFTPNADNTNDIFRVLGSNLEAATAVRLGIYNRFGQRVFYTEDKHKGWDGRFNNVDQEIGTYFYLLEYELRSQQYTKTGDVTLVR